MEKTLKSIFSKVRVLYPHDTDLWVEFYTDVPMGVLSNMHSNDSLTDVEKSMFLLQNIICDWNFANIDGTQMEINEESINKLPQSIATWIIEEINKVVQPDQTKKKD